ADQKRELDRLERNQAPQSEAEKRRLQDQRRELERLSKNEQQNKSAHEQNRRQLERLSRNLSEAAQGMQSGDSPSASQSMQGAADQAGRIADQLRKMGQAQRAQVQLGDLKEMLRRAGDKGQDGKGKDGKGGKMGEFLARAGGGKGQNQ